MKNKKVIIFFVVLLLIVVSSIITWGVVTKWKFVGSPNNTSSSIITLQPEQPNLVVTTQPVTTVPVTTQPVTTQPVTTQLVTTVPVTTQPVTTVPVTTQPVTTVPVTTQPVTTVPVTTQPVTTVPVTTQPVTIQPVTTQPVTTQPVTTQPVTTVPVTTQPVTTVPVTTSIDIVESFMTNCSSNVTCNFAECRYGENITFLDGDYLLIYGTIDTTVTTASVNPGFCALGNENTIGVYKWVIKPVRNAQGYRDVLGFTMYSDDYNELYTVASSIRYNNTDGSIVVLVYNNMVYLRVGDVLDSFDVSSSGQGFVNTRDLNTNDFIRRDRIYSMHVCNSYCCGSTPPTTEPVIATIPVEEIPEHGYVYFMYNGVNDIFLYRLNNGLSLYTDIFGNRADFYFFFDRNRDGSYYIRNGNSYINSNGRFVTTPDESTRFDITGYIIGENITYRFRNLSNNLCLLYDNNVVLREGAVFGDCSNDFIWRINTLDNPPVINVIPEHGSLTTVYGGKLRNDNNILVHQTTELGNPGYYYFIIENDGGDNYLIRNGNMYLNGSGQFVSYSDSMDIRFNISGLVNERYVYIIRNNSGQCLTYNHGLSDQADRVGFSPCVASNTQEWIIDTNDEPIIPPPVTIVESVNLVPSIGSLKNDGTGRYMRGNFTTEWYSDTNIVGDGTDTFNVIDNDSNVYRSGRNTEEYYRYWDRYKKIQFQNFNYMYSNNSGGGFTTEEYAWDVPHRFMRITDSSSYKIQNTEGSCLRDNNGTVVTDDCDIDDSTMNWSMVPSLGPGSCNYYGRNLCANRYYRIRSSSTYRRYWYFNGSEVTTSNTESSTFYFIMSDRPPWVFIHCLESGRRVYYYHTFTADRVESDGDDVGEGRYFELIPANGSVAILSHNPYCSNTYCDDAYIYMNGNGDLEGNEDYDPSGGDSQGRWTII